jgi:hypothetical protein
MSMNDIPRDALEAIDWLLSPTAADRRKEFYWQSVMIKAQIEIERLRADAERLRPAAVRDEWSSP